MQVVEALDARLLACHDVLLEDLSEPLLEVPREVQGHAGMLGMHQLEGHLFHQEV